MPKPQFQQPDGCSVSACSALVTYEQELAMHAVTEAKLRKLIIRESALIRQKNELLKQRDILAKESEHRLLNGLQMIASLLSLQSRTTENTETAAQLTIAAHRVATLGRIHRHLHTLDHSESVEFKRYLEKLCHELSELASTDLRERSLSVEGIELKIPTAAAIPLAFIASELITNSLKYAQGGITVSLQATPRGERILSVVDDGPGLPEGFDPAATKGLGMTLISALTKQIGGELQIEKGAGGQGAQFSILFQPENCRP
jgi:two-component sensor histidine kinase